MARPNRPPQKNRTKRSTAPVVAPVAAAASKVIDPTGGYQVTDHVLRYYATTRA